jgi:hypothetical protein
MIKTLKIAVQVIWGIDKHIMSAEAPTAPTSIQDPLAPAAR